MCSFLSISVNSRGAVCYDDTSGWFLSKGCLFRNCVSQVDCGSMSIDAKEIKLTRSCHIHCDSRGDFPSFTLNVPEDTSKMNIFSWSTVADCGRVLRSLEYFLQQFYGDQETTNINCSNSFVQKSMGACFCRYNEIMAMYFNNFCNNIMPELIHLHRFYSKTTKQSIELWNFINNSQPTGYADFNTLIGLYNNYIEVSKFVVSDNAYKALYSASGATGTFINTFFCRNSFKTTGAGCSSTLVIRLYNKCELSSRFSKQKDDRSFWVLYAILFFRKEGPFKAQ